MDERNLKRLEFNRIKENITALASSNPARELIGEMAPYTNKDKIIIALAEVTEGRELLRLHPTTRLDGWNDVRMPVQRCGRGALLDAEELWRICQTLSACRQIKHFFSEHQSIYTLFNEISLGLGNFKDLEKKITSSISGGEVLDNASEKLLNTRRRLNAAQQRIKERLNEIIRSAKYQKYLQDSIVTMREGRYVVPVKQEYRTHVPGIVHDLSASGATVFIEPMSVVETNNEVRSLLLEEKREITRILTELSAAVGEQSEELLYAVDTLGYIDFVMAKARYSEQLDAWAPKIIQEAKLDIRQGRHPLLTNAAVPISLQLGESFDMLVITGPNTGGKTVSLKTAGLFVVMAHSGIHLPAEEGTVIGMFDVVLADIGDEQSIEQSLSTFSSHTTNIIEILKQAGPKSLVLLDELGAGTDPTEGSALARAILDQLRKQGAKVMATTHYGELKSYAFANQRVANASVEFDIQSLRPTYRLLIGQPGHSNAFEIALRLGLAQEILQQAKAFLTEEQVQAADLIRELEKSRMQTEQEQIKAAQTLKEAEQFREKWQSQAEAIHRRKNEIEAKGVEDAKIIITKARLEAEQLIEELKASIKKQAPEQERSLVNARKRLKQLQANLNEKEPSEPNFTNDVLTNAKPGEEVFIPKYNQWGVILAADQADQVQVQVGALRLSIDSRELRRGKNKTVSPFKIKTDHPISGPKNRALSVRLDIRGMRVEEGLAEVEKHIDNACLAGLPIIQLVHGKGTGALRSAVQKLLKENPRVKTYRLGEQGEGGDGVTIVELN